MYAEPTKGGCCAGEGYIYAVRLMLRGMEANRRVVTVVEQRFDIVLYNCRLFLVSIRAVCDCRFWTSCIDYYTGMKNVRCVRNVIALNAYV